MATTAEQIKRWFDKGQSEGMTHLVVVCDTCDHEDYPVFVDKSSGVHTVVEKYNRQNMQRVLEVYDLSRAWDEQNERGVMNL